MKISEDKQPPQPRFEHQKYARERKSYREMLPLLLGLDFSAADHIHHFPAFAGELTLARYLSLYEAYKMTSGLAGHIAEVGIGTGSATLLFAKLCRLFEPHSLTLVHGFDWFQGAAPTSEEKHIAPGECRTSEDLVRDLVRIQDLEGIVHIHNLEVTTQLKAFLDEQQHLLFKLVFLDCGIHDVVAASIEALWPRLVPGGVLVLDHYSHEFAPGEARAVRNLLPHAVFRQFPFGWMPTAYAVKE